MEGSTLKKVKAFACGGAAACTAELFTLPVDTTKVRMQINVSKGGAQGMGGTMAHIVKTEGVSGLFKGISPAMQRQLVFASLRLGLYEHIRNFYSGGQMDASLGVKILSGLTAGAIGITVASPTDLVKVRMQADSNSSKPRYRGAMDAYRSIVRHQGMKGLWQGYGVNLTRNSIICAAELTGYDTAKQFLVGKFNLADGPLTHIMCASFAGLCGTLVGNPTDVVKTRYMNAMRSSNAGEAAAAPIYKSALDCLLTTVKNEGPMALYKGFFPNLARIAGWNICMFVAFEQYKKWWTTFLE